MAEDARSQAETDDLPDAREAFRSERDGLAEPSVAVSRAAALLTLVLPQQDVDEFLVATEEVREVLDLHQSVERAELGRDELTVELEGLGETGQRAAGLMRGERYTRRITDEPSGEFEGSVERSRRFVRELRGLPESERRVVDSVQQEAAEELFSTQETVRRGPRRDSAARLIAASLLDEDPLVQVAAAAAALRVDSRNPVAEAILDETARYASDEVAELSRAILTTDRGYDTQVVEIEYPPGAPDPAADSTLVHGTWARWGRWWRPDGTLHRYLREDEALFPHLYVGADPFKWSGYFGFRTLPKPTKDWNRQQAADSLAWWAHRKLAAPPDLIGHSYGGSLSMMTTQSEKVVRGLVLLSPAVHRTCLPDPANYEQILRHDATGSRLAG